MEVNFKCKDGFCPYFVWEKIRFFIQDRKISSNVWVYCLCSRNTDDKTISFGSTKEAEKFLKSKQNLKLQDNYCNYVVYEDKKHLYILKDKMLIIREKAVPITSYFDTYEECLKFSKEYVEDFIKRQDPYYIEHEQLSLIC